MTIESPKFGKKVESEKEARIKDVERQVNEIKDAKGEPVDPNIKEAVVAFNLLKFPTHASCEGHLRKEGASFPWVEVYAPEPEGWKENKEKQKQWTIENLKHRNRMMGVLEEFYKDRETPFDARLSFSNIGIYGGFRIQSTGAEVMPLLSPEEQKEKRKIYRKEMDDFAKFLKAKFLRE